MLLRPLGCFAIVFLFSAPSSLAGADWHRDIVYAVRDGQELKLDVVTPAEGEMRPALICIHGGGWARGNRASYHSQMEALAELGWVTVTIDYRLTDVATWPAQIDDCRDAMLWLVQHADQYGIDPERIAVVGQSAGAHLAVMLGTQPAENESVRRPRAVVNFFGPTDLRDIEAIGDARGLVEALIGGKLEENGDKLEAISPALFADRTDAPVITFHGTEDQIVSVEQGEILRDALTDAQVPNRFHPMEDVGHGIGGDVQKHLQAMRDFLSSYLHGGDMPLIAWDDFDDGSERWEMTDDAAWKAINQDGQTYLSLTRKMSNYVPKVRSPFNIALLRDVETTDFVLDVDLRSTHEPYGHQDLCLFFGYQDPSHFYYVHIGRNADAHANSIFLVNDEPRVSIAEERTDGTDWSTGWHRVRVKRDVESGAIEVYFDDMQTPVMKAVDQNFTWGRVGVGSFDDTGDFDSIRLYGTLREQ